MKRNVFASLILAAVFALTACGDKDKKEGEAKTDDTAATAGDPKAAEGATKPPETDKPAAGGAITPEDDKLAEAALAYFDELGTAAAAAGDDCDAMAKAITDAAAKHKSEEMFAKMEALDADEAKSKALEEKYGPQMEAKFGPIMQAMSKCQDNEAVQQALEAAMPKG